MSKWTHSICDDCWKKREPDKEPYRLVKRLIEECCFCGERHMSGIYLRENPENTMCKGACEV